MGSPHKTGSVLTKPMAQAEDGFYYARTLNGIEVNCQIWECIIHVPRANSAAAESLQFT